MRRHTKEYLEYLKSSEWRSKRKAALERANHACEKCGARDNLEVDHKHYNTLFKERPEDLRVLCTKCHPAADERRRQKNHTNAGMRTYAVKKYGEDWQDHIDPSDLAEEFREWRENRAED